MSGLEADRGVSWEGEDAIIRLSDCIMGEDASSATCLLVLGLQEKGCIRPKCVLKLIFLVFKAFLLQFFCIFTHFLRPMDQIWVNRRENLSFC